ncbi:MAG: RNA polymerase factor sigma-54, partial [Mangrovicoccus sp.]
MDLSLRQTQSLSLQMQQSLAMLSMPAEELAAFLREELARNPFLVLRGKSPFRGSPAATHADKAALIAQIPNAHTSMAESLSQQINLAFDKAKDRQIAQCFLEALAPTGWLSEPFADIAARGGCDLAIAEHVLAKLQQLEPAGIFARNLAECLRLQAEDQDLLTPAMARLLQNLDLLAGQKLSELARICRVSGDQLAKLIAQVKSFDPKPGLQFSFDPIVPKSPELRAFRDRQGWKVEIINSLAPALAVRAPGQFSDSHAAKEALVQARALIRAAERREATLLATGMALVQAQSAFLEKGPKYLRPLTLEDIAQRLDVHVSTVSRASSGHVIETPRGVMPMRDFFCRAVGCDELSPDALRDLVRQIIQSEKPSQPLGDEAIAQLAAQKGAHIARRTIAKYRDALGIPTSAKRRSSGGPAKAKSKI